MKKKKLEAKLTKTKKKLAAARTELDSMLSIMEASGMPKATSKPAAGKPEAAKPAATKPAAKPAVRPKAVRPAPKTTAKTKAKAK